MRAIKIRDKQYYPDGIWVRIASEQERYKVDDEDVYFYLDTDEDVNKIKVGQNIMLDEMFEVVEVEE
jgi:hypothetical protein